MTKVQNDKRIRVMVGHYGSGKTEFSVNYAVRLAGLQKKTALCDLDIANPYFRSREKQKALEGLGISVFSNTFGRDITADLPAITARIKTPLEDKSYDTVVDVGGDDLGARILIQFGKYLTQEDCDIFCVINANRPETNSFSKALGHINGIQSEIGAPVTGLVNNTHMLGETSAGDVMKGYRLCRELAAHLGIPLKYNSCTHEVAEELEKGTDLPGDFTLFPMELFMREPWQNRG